MFRRSFIFSSSSGRNTVSLTQFKSIVLSNLYRQYVVNKMKKSPPRENPVIMTIPAPPSQILIDVREPNELKVHGSVPFAVNVPLAELSETLLDAAEVGREKLQQQRLKRQQEDQDGETKNDNSSAAQDFDYESDPVDVIGAPGEKQVVFFCGHGVRSLYAMEMAESCGYRNCIHLGGGFSEYAADPVTKRDVEEFIKEKEANNNK